MIDYSKVGKGDILKMVGTAAPGFAAPGDLVRVVTVRDNFVRVEKRDGELADFWRECGAARLEATEWTGDFPEG